MAVDLSFLEPYFQALSQVPHLQQAAAQQEQQQQQLAETTRHDQADEAVAGRHADIAADANRRAQQAQDLTQADTIMKNGWTPVAGASGQGPGASAPAAPAAPVDLTNEMGGDPGNAAGGAPAPVSVPGLTGSLMSAAGTAPSPAAATPRQTMTVGGQQYQAPPAAGTPQWKEEHARQLQQGIDDDAAKHGATLNREGITIPDNVADVMQIPRGQKIMPEHMKALADLHNIVAPPDKQFKPEPPASMVTLSATDSKLMGLPAGTRVPMDEYKARGTVAAEASRAARGDGGAPAEKPLTSQERIGITNTYVNGMKDSEKQMNADREKAQSDKVKALSDAVQIEDPAAKAAAVKAAYDSFNGAMDGAAAQHKGRLSNLNAAYTTNGRLAPQTWADNMPDKAPTSAAATSPGRGGTAAAAPGGVPANVQSVLKTQGPGIHTLSDGSKWMKDASGNISRQ